MNERVAAIIRSYSSRFCETRAFFFPEIPPKKTINAIKSYANGMPENDVLFLLDYSVLGSGKEGVILSADTLFVRNLLEKPNKIAITDIQNITIEPSKSASSGMLLVQVKGPQSQIAVPIKDQDTPLFSQMILDVKRELLSAGTGAPEIDLPVKETALAPRAEFVRLVPIKEGRNRRYSFIHLPLQGSQYGTVENQRAGLFSHPKVTLDIETKNNRVTARTDGNDVFVNDKRLVGKQYLADQDRISLGTGNNRADYLFQADPKTAKQLRKKDEQARGIVRGTGGQRSDTYRHERFVIDQGGIRLGKHEGGTKLLWKALTEVTFSADYDFIYKKTGNLGNAAGQGVAIGAQNATSTMESQELSDLNAAFPAPFYMVKLLSNGKVVGEVKQLDQRGCAWIDEAIERFAPMDLVTFKLP